MNDKRITDITYDYFSHKQTINTYLDECYLANIYNNLTFRGHAPWGYSLHKRRIEYLIANYTNFPFLRNIYLSIVFESVFCIQYDSVIFSLIVIFILQQYKSCLSRVQLYVAVFKGDVRSCCTFKDKKINISWTGLILSEIGQIFCQNM